MKIALVLSGGGARGAYEAGVLRYLREGLPRAAGRRPADVRLDILCGTSIGAINACFLASTAHQPEAQAARLADVWRSLRLEDVFRWSTLSYSAIPSYVYRQLRELKLRQLTWRLSDFLHPEALARVVKEIDWTQLARNVADGHTQALTVTATDLGTGHSVVFVQTAGALPIWGKDPLIEGRQVTLGPEHALASGAIPLLFRPVRIGEAWFADGSIRQNTPLAPAVRLGADRLLVIGLRYRGLEVQPPPSPDDVPGTAAQLGKVLNALHADRTDHDLEELHRVNALLDQGRAAFGPDFEERLNAAATQTQGWHVRHVRDLVIRPSQDIGQIARRHAVNRLQHMPPGSLASRLLRRAATARQGADGAADLASYLLFDRGFAEELMNLGWADAERQREALATFFWSGG